MAEKNKTYHKVIMAIVGYCIIYPNDNNCLIYHLDTVSLYMDKVF